MMKTHPALRYRQMSASGRIFRVALAAALACSALLPVSAPAQESGGNLTEFMSGINNLKQDTQLSQLMNFNKCLQFKIGAGMHWCPGIFGIKIPSPCVKFTYNEPTNVNEATPDHKGKYLNTGFGLTDIFFGGAGKRPEEKKSYRPLKSGSGQYRHQFDEARIYYVTPIARFLSSATPLQATKSLTCGLFGLGDIFPDYSAMTRIQPPNLLTPSKWGSGIMERLRGMGSAWRGMISQPQPQPGTLPDLTPASWAEGPSREGMPGGSGSKGPFSAGVERMPGLISNFSAIYTSSITELERGFEAIGPSLASTAAGALQVMETDGPAATAQLLAFMEGTVEKKDLDADRLLRLAKAMSTAGPALGELGMGMGDNDMINLGLGLTSGGHAATTLAVGLQADDLGEGEIATLAQDTLVATYYGLGTELPVEVVEAGPSLGEIAQPLANPFTRWTNALRGDNFGKAKDGLVPVGELRNGYGLVTYLDAVMGNVGLEYRLEYLLKGYENTRTALPSFTPGELCSLEYGSKAFNQSLKDYVNILAMAELPFKIAPAATYLNAHQRGLAPSNQPNAACPATNSGFVQTGAQGQISVLNCQEYCWTVRTGPDGTTERACRIVPAKGYGGSCYTNAISKQVITSDGRVPEAFMSLAAGGSHPACNGHTPPEVADGRGGTISVGNRYDPRKDQLGALNRALRTMWATKFEASRKQVEGHLANIQSHIASRGGACDELGSPTGPWAHDAEVRRPPSSQTAWVITTNGKIEFPDGRVDVTVITPEQWMDIMKAGGPYSGSQEVERILRDARMAQEARDRKVAEELDPKTETMEETVKKYLEGMDKIAEQARIAGRFSGILPQVGKMDKTKGLPGEEAIARVFATRYEITAETLVDKALEDPTGAAALALCDSVGRATFFTTGGIDTTTSKPLSPYIGCWGPRFPMVGYTHASSEEKGQHIVQERGAGISKAIGILEKPKSNGHFKGVPRRNVDHPHRHSDSDVLKAFTGIGTTMAGRHKGSGCYPVGTGDPRMFNPGESFLPIGALLTNAFKSLNPLSAKAYFAPGHSISTDWKDTQCCIPIFCPYNVRRDY